MRILILPGDGIGPEVTAEARRVLHWFVTHRRLDAAIDERRYGVAAARETGTLMPSDTKNAILAADVILFGAFGAGGSEDQNIAVQYEGGLLYIRQLLDLYVNLRPIKTHRVLFEASSLKNRVLEGVDLVIVRELTGGIYFGKPRLIESLPDGQRRGINTQVYTSSEIERISRYAFELARSRRGALCSVDKANVLESSVLWREVVQKLHDREFPDVKLSHMYVDNAAMQLIRNPAQFDVMLTDNIFGDILSDCASMAAGSLGMLPSASVGALTGGSFRRGFYEPVHGSAPDIAGKGIANPLGSILSLAMAFRESMRLAEDADLLEKAVVAALTSGARTADIAEPGQAKLSCSEMGNVVLKQLDAHAEH
jgi:3-isopropylmalate dehydrogenase